MKLVLKAEVCAVRKGLELTYSTDHTALDRLCRVQLGKTILFTDNADWSDEDIVLAYRSQYHIENAFRQMKNPHFLGPGSGVKTRVLGREGLQLGDPGEYRFCETFCHS